MERIRRVLRLVFRNIYYYRVDYIRTFLMIRLFQVFIVLPLVSILFTFMLDAIGIQSITEQNIWQLLMHPFVLTMLVLIVLVFLLFIYYEMGFLMLLAYHQQRAIPYTIKGLWQRLNQKVLYFISFQTILFVIYLMLVIPLISTVLPLSITQNLQIPRFIVDELLASTKGRLMYYGAITFILVVGLRFIFTLPFFTIYHWMTIWEAVKMSWQFSKRKLIETLGILALILTVHVTIIVTILVLAFVPLYIIERALPGNALVVAAFTLTFVEGVLILAFSLLQAMFSQILVLVSFKLTHEKPLITQNESFRQTILHWTVVIAIYSYFLISGFNILSLEKTVYEPTTNIIAHRGFMEKGVENTISSLIASAEAGADMVEIDIQQTKDGKFIVFHDAKLSRLAGKRDSVYTMTQAQLMETIVRAEGLSDTIPSLEQMLEKSEELNVRLLIEIKTHGHETNDMLERLIAVLDEYKALDVHYIQSLDIEIAKQIKAMEPRLKVGAVYALNVGYLPKTELDFIVIEQFFVTERLIEQAKQQEKQLFVWTVNDSRSLQKFLEYNVDGIITNRPDRANDLREVLAEEQYFLNRIWNKIQVIF
ncbi:glycerophosphoryl diester phosphodiesterase membrane domain-containing protein [Lysinibacillus sp. LZ02]|uniref:glycerophosphoryl diester phosphodiesterase membrane domain-containing protein n=1 Tax=Lysinibacillus sp. LZ02 TaxID=3420668 RepID=UPI003D363E81